jgi:hypothetical protein
MSRAASMRENAKFITNDAYQKPTVSASKAHQSSK